MRSDLEAIRDLVLGEVNVKELVILDAARASSRRRSKPDFKKLGARLGKAYESRCNGHQWLRPGTYC
jgi:isoleucyl-tRNA synthetase